MEVVEEELKVGLLLGLVYLVALVEVAPEVQLQLGQVVLVIHRPRARHKETTEGQMVGRHPRQYFLLVAVEEQVQLAQMLQAVKVVTVEQEPHLLLVDHP
jgi:hypothetical protein